MFEVLVYLLLVTSMMHVMTKKAPLILHYYDEAIIIYCSNSGLKTMPVLAETLVPQCVAHPILHYLLA